MEARVGRQDDAPEAADLGWVAAPVARTALVGRDELLARAGDALREPAVRLLTLTGPGGVGKTTLARALAAALEDAFPDGVAVAELAAERDPDRLPTATVQALGLDPTEGETPLATLARSLTGRRLLVLDNLEQVVSGAGVLGDLLTGLPDLTVLTTSRIRLGLAGEREVPVPPLALPGVDARPMEEVAASAAVELFARRARRANPGFSLTPANARAVAEICRRLDGLPLALELGAARLRLLSPEALLDRLGARLDLLSGGPQDSPVRHRTIRGTVAWSVDLLRPEERRLFGCLAVFAGGCTVDDLLAVARASDPDLVVTPATAQALVDASLLQPSADANGDPRLTMLESVRDVAVEDLAASGRAGTVQRAHAERYAAVAEREGPGLRSASTTQIRVWNRLSADVDNARAAMAWALGDSGDPIVGLRVAVGLDWFWTDGAFIREGIDWLERLVAAGSPTVVPRSLTGHANRILAMLYDWLGRADELQRAVDVAIDALAASDDHAATAEVLMLAFGAASERGDTGLARAHAERALVLAETHGLDWVGASMGVNLAVLLTWEGEYAAAARHAATAVERYRRVGEQGVVVAAFTALGSAQMLGGDLVAGAATLLEALEVADLTSGTDQGDGTYYRNLFANAGILAARAGRPEEAVRLVAAGDAEIRRTGIPLRRPFQRIVDAEVDSLRDALAGARFSAAWSAGAALSQAQQIALAKDVLGSIASPTLTGKLSDLSARQLEVLRLLVAGASDQDIADALFISRRTASEHVSNVIRALGQGSRTAAATYAAAQGLRPSPSPAGGPANSG